MVRPAAVTSRFLLPLLFCLSFSIPLVASYRTGPEVAVSPVEIGPSEVGGFRTSVTYDGTQHVAFWEDWRGRREIYAARVTSGGEVLDPAGIPIGVAGANLVRPMAVWTGSRHLVLSTSDDPYERPTAYLMALAPNGEILELPRKLSDGGHGMAIAAVGDRVLTFRAREGSIVADVLDSAGTIIRAGLALPNDVLPRAAAGSADRVLVVSSGYSGIAALRFDREGRRLDGINTSLISSVRFPSSVAVASDGRDFLVVWSDGRRIMARRVTAEGAALPAFAVGQAAATVHGTAVSWGGGRFVVAWHEGDAINAASILEDGRVSVSSLSPSASAGSISISAAPSPLAVWMSRESGAPYVVAKPLASEGAEVVLSMAAAKQLEPHLRARGDGFEATWIETRHVQGRSSIISADVTSGGRIGVPRARTASPDGHFISSGAAAAATAGVELVVWREDVLIEGHRRSRILGQLDGLTAPVEIGALDSGVSGPAVSAADRSFLVSWTVGTTVRAVVLNVDGSVAARLEMRTPDPGGHLIFQTVSAPNSAWDGERYLLVWSVVAHAGLTSRGEVIGVFVAPDGTLAQPFQIETAIGSEPDVASSGSGFLVVWRGIDAASRQWREVGATAVSRNGAIIGTTLLDTSEAASMPRVAWSGRDFIVTWLEGERDPSKLRGARLTTGARPVALFDIVDAAAGIRGYAVAARDHGRAAVAYTRFAAEAGGVSRVFVRILEPVVRTRAVRR